MRLTGKTAVVTGGGSGFGEGIAKTYAREGANVVVNDINGAAAERVASEIAIAGGKAIAVTGDITRGEDWQQLRSAALEDFGSVEIVVNNAGTTHRNKPVLDVSEAEFDRVYAVNVKGIYWSVREFVPYFRERGGGVFVNIASTAGVRPRPGLVWYNGSKGAVIITSKSMAAELGPDQIRVNCINPVFNADRSSKEPWDRQNAWEFWKQVRDRVVADEVSADATDDGAFQAALGLRGHGGEYDKGRKHQQPHG